VSNFLASRSESAHISKQGSLLGQIAFAANISKQSSVNNISAGGNSKSIIQSLKGYSQVEYAATVIQCAYRIHR
jgi:hypothetical protein